MQEQQLRRSVPLAWQLVVLIASLGVLGILALSLLAPLPTEIKRLFDIADTAICFVFLADFLLLFYLHNDRKKYFLTWGWIDLLSSIPLFDPLRWGRLARMVRLLRLFRGLRGSAGLLRRLLYKRQETTLAAIFLFICAVLVFSSTATLIAEEGAEGKISTAEEALWFTLSTMTTVGYGDVYPITTTGRVVAALTMMAGIGIFGAFTALVASLLVKSGRMEGQVEQLLAQSKQQSDTLNAIRDEIQGLRDRGRD